MRQYISYTVEIIMISQGSRPRLFWSWAGARPAAARRSVVTNRPAQRIEADRMSNALPETSEHKLDNWSNNRRITVGLRRLTESALTESHAMFGVVAAARHFFWW